MNYFPFHIGETLQKRNSRLRSERLRAAKEKGSHTNSQWERLVSEFGGRCVQCGAIPPEKIQKDHIVPIYQGGSDGIENLQPLCRRCNTAKGPDKFNWVAYRRQNDFGEVGA